MSREGKGARVTPFFNIRDEHGRWLAGFFGGVPEWAALQVNAVRYCLPAADTALIKLGRAGIVADLVDVEPNRAHRFTPEPQSRMAAVFASAAGLTRLDVDGKTVLICTPEFAHRVAVALMDGAEQARAGRPASRGLKH